MEKSKRFEHFGGKIERKGTTRCRLSTSLDRSCFSPPITQSRERDGTSSGWAKRHFKCALQRLLGLYSHTVYPEGNLWRKNTAELLVAIESVFVCLCVCFVCLSKPILLTTLATMLLGLGFLPNALWDFSYAYSALFTQFISIPGKMVPQWHILSSVADATLKI